MYARFAQFPARTRRGAWASLIFLCVVIFLLSSRPHLGTNLGLIDLVLRKAAHISEYLLLTCAAIRVLELEAARLRSSLLVACGAIFSLLYSVSDEWHQSFVAGRVGSPVDVVIDGVGIGIGALLAARAMQKRDYTTIQKEPVEEMKQP